jgi:leader peptidase (prepilin peptidase)/N-methyltransferase
MRGSLATAPAGARSACDGCRRQLGWLETAPILSFIALRGRCRTCASAISLFHPSGELVGLVAMVAIALIAPDIRGAAMAIMAMALLAVSVRDILTHRLTFLSIGVVGACAVFLAWCHGPYDLLVGLANATLWSGLLSAVAAIYRLGRGKTGLGLGDILLVAVLSIWLGVAASWIVLIAPILTAVIAVLTSRLRKALPFGPMIALSGFIIGLLLEAGLWPRL